jgi:hypothetical protein
MLYHYSFMVDSVWRKRRNYKQFIKYKHRTKLLAHCPELSIANGATVLELSRAIHLCIVGYLTNVCMRMAVNIATMEIAVFWEFPTQSFQRSETQLGHHVNSPFCLI